MNVALALALRRALVVGGAIGAAMIGHLIASGDAGVTPMTPFAWGTLTFVAMLLGARRRFRPRGFIGTALLLSALQAATHMAMGVAPWAFGIAFHHATLTPSLGMTLAHLGALLLAAALIARVERILAHALRIAEIVTNVFSRRPPPRTPRVPRRLPSPAHAVTLVGARPHPARGPPLLPSC